MLFGFLFCFVFSYLIVILWIIGVNNKFKQYINIRTVMLFGGRSVSPINTRSTKNQSKVVGQPVSKSPLKRQTSPIKLDASKTNYNKAQLKTKQTMGILYSLQEIYNQLNFNDFDAFSQQRIVQARKKIQQLSNFFRDQPRCPIHKDLLNLYCQNEKQLICVSCVYKGNQQHKNHKVRPLETVQKTIQYQLIRNEQKTKSLVNQLSIMQEQISKMQNEICEQYMTISTNALSIISETIRQLQAMKQEYNVKISLAYRRTCTIIKRYSQSVDLMINLIDANLQKASTLDKNGKYLLLKEVNREHQLIEDLVAKFNQNKMLLQQWKKSMKETEKIVVKKKKQKFKKDQIYIVTQF